MAKLKPEFDKRNTKIIGLSVDPVDDHTRWMQDIEDATGNRPNYPLIGDSELKVAQAYGMLPAEAGDSSRGRTAADNQTVRNVFVVGSDKKIKLILVYPMSTGRNFDEILRVMDSLQLTAKHQVATPVNWRQGEDVIIVPAVSDEDAKKKFPEAGRRRSLICATCLNRGADSAPRRTGAGSTRRSAPSALPPTLRMWTSAPATLVSVARPKDGWPKRSAVARGCSATRTPMAKPKIADPATRDRL